MNDLKRQVQRARRRLVLQQFLSITLWTLFASLMIAALGVAIPKIWPVGIDATSWTWSWIGGSLATGLIVAITLTLVRRKDSLEAAIEIDRRFGLKERVSSCLSLSPDDQDSQAGRALVDDAVRRVNQVNVAEKFNVSPGRWAWLPISAAVLVFALTFLSDAQPDASSTVDAATVSAKKRVQTSTEQLKKKIEQRRKQALEKGLEDASDLFKKVEQGLEDDLANKNDVDRKKAMVKLNDLANDIRNRQKQLGDQDEMRKQLNQLKDLKPGPADRMAKAISNGDFRAAIDELKKLEDKMREGTLSKEDQAQLKQQIDQLRDKLQQMADAQEQAKRDLQKQIEQKLAQGDRKGAAQLQKKLENLQAKDQQMKKMSMLAQKLGECSQCMSEGNAQQAADAMAAMADSLEQMQMDMDELEMLEDALASIDSAKDAMNCSNCNGQGCSLCQGDGLGQGMGMGNGMGDGMGLGQGRGRGDRPEEETSKNFYDSQVRSKLGKGKAVVSGIASGPNKAGQALEEVKVEIEASKQSNDDPLTGQRLPKPQRELAREYFNAFLDE